MVSHSQLAAQLDRLREVSARFQAEADIPLNEIRALRLSRMERVYSDLYEQTRYRQAVRFLIHDLFGTEELGDRGRELERARSAMERILPGAMLSTVARAVEFTALTLELDLAVGRTLAEISSAEHPSVRECHQAIGSAAGRDEFEQQINLVVAVGREIEHVVHKPFVSTALKMCRRPARSMGLSGLQDFLERGFRAFKQMEGSEAFLETFRRREMEFLDEVFEE